MTRKTIKPLRGKLPPDHPFADIIAEAYRVFAVPTPSDTGVCKGCCMEPEIEADFFAPPIDEMPLHYLSDWYFAACNPPLAQNIWRYLLPRVLEVLASGEELASVGLEVSLNRFATGDASLWRAEEWSVLDEFQRVYLRRALNTRGDYLDDVLCMFGIAGWPLQDLFDQLLDMPTDRLIERLWHDWCQGHASIWLTAFWEGGGNEAAYAFYTSPALYQRISTLALDPGTEAVLAEKALAVAALIEREAG